MPPTLTKIAEYSKRNKSEVQNEREIES